MFRELKEGMLPHRESDQQRASKRYIDKDPLLTITKFLTCKNVNNLHYYSFPFHPNTQELSMQLIEAEREAHKEEVRHLYLCTSLRL